MNPLQWFSRRQHSGLDAHQLQRRDALPLAQALDDTPLDQGRMVVVDLETSGLNTQRDKVLSIGAVVIENAAVDMGSQYE